MNREDRRELERILSALCDGGLTEEQNARLEQLLRADGECRRFYLQYMDLHARLLTHPISSAQPADELVSVDADQALVALLHHAPPGNGTSTGATPARRLPALRQAVRYGMVAAVTLAASLLIQFVLWPPPDGGDPAPANGAAPVLPVPSYIATLTGAADCAGKEQPRPCPPARACCRENCGSSTALPGSALTAGPSC
jgi:hypothetical protein